MKTLIIYAHPDIEGHCSHILDETRKQLEIKKIEYEVIDLYAIRYDPILNEDELKNKRSTDQTLEIQQKISETDKLIFIYPIWWGSMPAMMKGFFDKTLNSGFAYKFNSLGIPKGLLKEKKAIVFTTSGSPVTISRFFLGNRFQNGVKIDILGWCGVNTKVYQIGRCIKWNDDRMPEVKSIVNNGIKWLY